MGLDSGIQDFARKKLNLVILIDVSGSMSSPFDSYYYDSTGATVYLTPEGLLNWAEWIVARHSADW